MTMSQVHLEASDISEQLSFHPSESVLGPDQPVSFVALVATHVNTFAVLEVILPLTFVVALVGPKVFTLAVFFVHFVLASVVGVVVEFVYAFSLLAVLEPLTFIAASIEVAQRALSVSLVLFELPNVLVSIAENESAEA